MTDMCGFYSDLIEVIVLLCIVGAILLAGYIAIDLIRSEEEEKRMEVIEHNIKEDLNCP